MCFCLKEKKCSKYFFHFRSHTELLKGAQIRHVQRPTEMTRGRERRVGTALNKIKARCLHCFCTPTPLSADWGYCGKGWIFPLCPYTWLRQKETMQALTASTNTLCSWLFLVNTADVFTMAKGAELDITEILHHNFIEFRQINMWYLFVQKLTVLGMCFLLSKTLKWHFNKYIYLLI